VRAVLERGLAPDPAKRWPDIPAVLDALQDARRAPQRRRLLVIAGAALAIAGVLVAKLATREAAAPAPPCEPEERAFERTWSVASTSEAAESLLDGARGRWLASYRRVCAQPSAPAFNQRLGCLLASRDFMLDLVPVIKQVVDKNDVFSMLPDTDACETAAPPTPPQRSDDAAVRARVADLRVRALKLGGEAKPRELVDGLVAEARNAGWSPLVCEVMYAAGRAVRYNGGSDLSPDSVQARQDLARQLTEGSAIEAAATRHAAIAAHARLELVDFAFDRSLNVRDAGELARVMGEARAAITAAGGSPSLLSRLDQFSARLAMTDGKPEIAVDVLARRHAMLLEQGDNAAALETVGLLARAYLLRGHAGDLDAALAAVRATSQRLDPRWGPAMVARLSGELAFRKGDLGAAHRAYDDAHHNDSYDLVQPITGTVVDRDGTPVEGATVVAWSGVLEADSERIYMASDNPVAATDRAGRFTIRARATAIVAEKGDLRSRPQPVAAGSGLKPVPATTLRLTPTRSLSGRITEGDGARVDVEGFASMQIGKDRFLERAPLARDGSFVLSRVPEGITAAGARDQEETIGTAPTGALSIAWPARARLDVIVGGARLESTVHVLRGKPAPRSRDELMRLVGAAMDTTESLAYPIGNGNATDSGRELYLPGDQHCVLDHVGEGEVTVCASDDKRFACVPYEQRGAATHAVRLVLP
jgi:hypothetical protein